MRSPQSLTLTESNPGTVNRYSVYAKRVSDNAIIASKDYAIAGTTTVCPIGSDTFFQSVNDGEVINLHVIERVGAGSDAADVDQLVPGGPFTVSTYPNGAENIVVQL